MVGGGSGGLFPGRHDRVQLGVAHRSWTQARAARPCEAESSHNLSTNTKHQHLTMFQEMTHSKRFGVPQGCVDKLDEVCDPAGRGECWWRGHGERVAGCWVVQEDGREVEDAAGRRRPEEGRREGAETRRLRSGADCWVVMLRSWKGTVLNLPVQETVVGVSV